MDMIKDRFMNKKEVLNVVSCSATQLYYLTKRGEFPSPLPRPINASRNCPLKWSQNDINLYVEFKKRGIIWGTEAFDKEINKQ